MSHFDLHAAAVHALVENGSEPEPGPEATQQAARASLPPLDPAVRDLRALPWSSIDNAEARDRDQLEVAHEEKDGGVRILVAVADVDVLVPRGSAVDRHARGNSTSVYSAGEVFPMLPVRLSTDLTSLKQDADRLAIVIET